MVTLHFFSFSFDFIALLCYNLFRLQRVSYDWLMLVTDCGECHGFLAEPMTARFLLFLNTHKNVGVESSPQKVEYICSLFLKSLYH